jgi:hypothetical protein
MAALVVELDGPVEGANPRSHPSSFGASLRAGSSNLPQHRLPSTDETLHFSAAASPQSHGGPARRSSPFGHDEGDETDEFAEDRDIQALTSRALTPGTKEQRFLARVHATNSHAKSPTPVRDHYEDGVRDHDDEAVRDHDEPYDDGILADDFDAIAQEAEDAASWLP